MERRQRQYPDISDVLAAKKAWRHERAKLTFAEKLDALDALRARVQPIIEARRTRRIDTRPAYHVDEMPDDVAAMMLDALTRDE